MLLPHTQDQQSSHDSSELNAERFIVQDDYDDGKSNKKATEKRMEKTKKSNKADRNAASESEREKERISRHTLGMS